MLEVEQVDKAVTPQHLIGQVGGARLDENTRCEIHSSFFLETAPELSCQSALSPLPGERQSRSASSGNRAHSCCRTDFHCQSCAPRNINNEKVKVKSNTKVKPNMKAN